MTTEKGPPCTRRARPLQWKKIVRALGLITSLGILVIATMLFFEDKFIFFPERYPNGDWEAPVRERIPVQDVFLKTSSNATLHGWYIPSPKSPLILIYFHGNAGNITHRWDWAKRLRSLNTNIFLFDYRGYGKSSGTPTEKNLYEDAQRVYKYITKERKYQPHQIILYGESLGTAPACYLASQHKVRALILRSPFTNAKDMAEKILPLPFVQHIIRSRLPNDEYIQQAKCPVLVIHAGDDHVVPLWQGERVFQLAPDPKALIRLPDGNHNTIEEKHGETLLHEMNKFIEQTSTQ